MAFELLASAIRTAWASRILRPASGAALNLWALYLLLYGERHRARVGMQTGLCRTGALVVLIAGAHGAGLISFPP